MNSDFIPRTLSFLFVIALVLGTIWLIMSGFFAAFPPAVNKALIIAFIVLTFTGPAGINLLLKPRKPKYRSTSETHYNRTLRDGFSRQDPQTYYNMLRQGGMKPADADKAMAEYFPGEPYQRSFHDDFTQVGDGHTPTGIPFKIYKRK